MTSGRAQLRREVPHGARHAERHRGSRLDGLVGARRALPAAANGAGARGVAVGPHRTPGHGGAPASAAALGAILDPALALEVVPPAPQLLSQHPRGLPGKQAAHRPTVVAPSFSPTVPAGHASQAALLFAPGRRSLEVQPKTMLTQRFPVIFRPFFVVFLVMSNDFRPLFRVFCALFVHSYNRSPPAYHAAPPASRTRLAALHRRRAHLPPHPPTPPPPPGH